MIHFKLHFKLFHQLCLTFRTQSSNNTTILIRESQLFIKLTNALWSAFSISTPFMDNITSPTI